MPVKIGGSYVSEMAYSFATANNNEENTETNVIKALNEKFPNLKFSIGAGPFSGSGTNNVSISPKILKQMENDPQKRMEYEALIYDIANTPVQSVGGGRKLKSHGFIIGDDGGLRGWGISEGDDGNRRHQSSVQRSDKNNWWQELLAKNQKKKGKAGKTNKSLMKAMQEKIEEKRKEKEAEFRDIPELPQEQRTILRPTDKHVEDILRANAEMIMAIPYNGNPVLAKAYLQNTKATGKSPDFGNVDELNDYLRSNYQVVSGGMTSISGKYLQKCLTDSESRERLFDILQAADEAYASRKDEVGFQGMKVTIDENGEVTSESSKSTVTENEGKRRRQIAAAATRKDMQAVLALLEQDLQEVENGLRQNMCDEAEVQKVKRLIEAAKERMGKLPEREDTPEEENIMTINMLI